MTAVLRRSTSLSSSIVALIIFMIVMECVRYSSADAATEILKCEVPSIPLEVIDLISSVNATLQTIKHFLSPTSGEEEEEEGSCDTSSSKEPVVQTGLLLLLLRKMEADNRQLNHKFTRLEEDHAKMTEDTTQMSLELKNVQAELLNVQAELLNVQAELLNVQEAELLNVQEAESQTSDTLCHCTQWPRDCHDLLHHGKNESGIYTIYPQKEIRLGDVSEGGVRVWCDLEGEEEGWTTVLLRRPLEDQVDFNVNWESYKSGFGNPETEYWIGNDVLHAMTTGRMQMLRVDMMDWDGNTAYAEYETIKIDSEEEKFRLHLGGYSGNAGDSLNYHNNKFFSTPDRDNDNWSGHCAQSRKAGFWYGACKYASPTHQLLKKQKNHMGITWFKWRNDQTTLKKMSFKLKPAVCLRG